MIAFGPNAAGLIFDKAGTWIPMDGVMDRTMLDGVAPHATLSQPYFVDGDPSLVENIAVEDADGDWQPLESMVSGFLCVDISI
jgi:hypothetical protein